MLSAYHNTKRKLCNTTFMYFINRGQSRWWLSRDVINLPRYKENIYVTLHLCILSTEARVGGGCPAMLSAHHNTKRNLCNTTFMYFINRGQSRWWLSRDVINLPRYKENIYVTLRLCILSTDARVGGGCRAMLSVYHNTKRNLCNVTFMYFINRGQSWWWLSRDVISLP